MVLRRLQGVRGRGGDRREPKDEGQGVDRVPRAQRQRRRVPHRHDARAGPRGGDGARRRRQAREGARAGLHGRGCVPGLAVIPIGRGQDPGHDGLGRRGGVHHPRVHRR